MTMSLLARWFGVPFLIVSLIIGSAVVVVLLFGAIAAENERSIDELLDRVESMQTDRLGGRAMFDLALMPQDKEVWQAARELALRLEKKDAELTPQEVDQVVERLATLVNGYLPYVAGAHENQLGPLHFCLAALSHTDRPAAAAPILRALEAPAWQTRREAITGLARLHELPEARRAAGRVVSALEDEHPVVRTVAAFALSFLADPNDEEIRTVLVRACEDPKEDREVQWNAALTLARLGSSQAKGVLLDMLDRTYWEEKAKVRLEKGGSGFDERDMPPGQVIQYLIITIEAVENVNDEDAWASVERLTSDKSFQVAEAARAALERRRLAQGAD